MRRVGNHPFSDHKGNSKSWKSQVKHLIFTFCSHKAVCCFDVPSVQGNVIRENLKIQLRYSQVFVSDCRAFSLCSFWCFCSCQPVLLLI